MARRFLLEIRDQGHPESEVVAHRLFRSGLQLAYSSERVRLFTNHADAVWQMRNGVGFGHLFSRHAPLQHETKPLQSLDLNGPTDALHRYWGAYILCFEDDQGVLIARDPSGMLPCYHGLWDGIFYAASDAALLFEANGQQPAIDWHSLGWMLYVNGLPQRVTALSGVHQLLPGMTLTIERGRTQEAICWSPWTHVNRPAPGLETFRQLVLDCIAAWAAQFRSILIGISGGLDSSIVAFGARHHAGLHAFTISAGDARGDERPYAHDLARSLEIPLAEAAYDLGAVDITRSSFIHAPRPGGRAQLQAYDKSLVDLARRYAADAFFSGVGGDNVFYLTGSARSLVDRYLLRGTPTQLWSTLSDICRLTGATPWQVVKQALHIPLADGPKYQWRPNSHLLAHDLIADFRGKSLAHPWLDGPPDSLPGKAAHVAMLVRAQGYMEAQDRRFPFEPVHPLMSQPIVEACLAIPSWEACRGGVERSFARRSFVHDLPPSVIERRVKGGPDHFALQILRTQLPTIRERLLDGALVRNHIADKPAMENLLTEAGLSSGGGYTRILSLLDTEAWVDGWRTGDLRPSWR
jgi:asparagine synthase (glutamine-hydrolysing)